MFKTAREAIFSITDEMLSKYEDNVIFYVFELRDFDIHSETLESSAVAGYDISVCGGEDDPREDPNNICWCRVDKSMDIVFVHQLLLLALQTYLENSSSIPTT